MSPQFNPADYDPTKDGGKFVPPPEGDYEFSVLEATDKTSVAGNEMLALTLAFEIGRDKPLNVFDQLVFVPKAIWKAAQFCHATGHDFDSGNLEALAAIGLSGKAHLELGEENAKGKRYMTVAYYCKPEGFVAQPATKPKPSPQAAPEPDADEPPPVDYGELPGEAETIPF